jgi:hypothetical protein
VIPLVVPLDLDKPLCPMGKQLRSPRFSARGGAFPDRGSFLNLNLHTWRNLLVSLYLALGRVFGKRLGRSSGSRNGLFCKGLRLGRFLPRPKPKVLQQPKVLVGAIPTAIRGSLLRPEISSAVDYGVCQEVSSSGGGSFPAVVPVMPPSPFVFPRL